MLCVATAMCAVAATLVALAVAPTARATVSVDSYVSGRFTTHKSEPAFLRGPGDDDGHVSYEIGTLKIHPPTAFPIYLVGDSLIRESITSTGDVATRIQTATGVTANVYLFGEGNQNFAESLAVVDNLPPGPGVVVISVSQNRFCSTPSAARDQIQGVRLLAPSTTLWRFILQTFGTAPRNSIKRGIETYLADWRHRNARILAAGRRPWHPYQQHRQGPPVSLERKQALVEAWLNDRGRPDGPFDDWHRFNTFVLERVVTRAQARGFTVVLMDGSQDGEIIGDAWDRCARVYRSACRQIAEDEQVAYVDPNLTAGLVDSDFHDVTHLIEPGRTKWMDALTTLLAPTVLRVAGVPATTPSAGPAATPSPSAPQAVATGAPPSP